MAGYNFSQNIIGLNKTNGDIHELEVEVANLSASVLSIAGDVDELELSISQLSASTLPYSSDETIKEKIDDEFIIVNGSIPLNYVTNTWTLQQISTQISIPSGYKVVSAMAWTAFPHADICVCDIKETTPGYFYIATFSTRTVEALATLVRILCIKEN